MLAFPLATTTRSSRYSRTGIQRTCALNNSDSDLEMRTTTTILACKLVWIVTPPQPAWSWCDPVQAPSPYVDLRATPLRGSVGADGLSSFGGITLSSSPREVEVALGRIGIVSAPTTFVGDPQRVSSFDFCKNDVYVGS